jgi:hypothetical protein
VWFPVRFPHFGYPVGRACSLPVAYPGQNTPDGMPFPVGKLGWKIPDAVLSGIGINVTVLITTTGAGALPLVDSSWGAKIV